MDVTTQLKLAVKTGEVTVGYKQALDALKAGRAKMLILSSNCPPTFKQRIRTLTAASKLPLYLYHGSSLDLGLACGKRFAVSTVTIKKPGDSDILRLVEA